MLTVDMPTREVSLKLDRDDRTTTQLARTLLVTEIAVQILGCLVVLDMLEHGAVTYKAKWYFERWRDKASARRGKEIEYRKSLGRMLYEASEIIEKGAEHE